MYKGIYKDMYFLFPSFFSLLPVKFQAKSSQQRRWLHGAALRILEVTICAACPKLSASFTYALLGFYKGFENRQPGLLNPMTKALKR